MKCPTTESTLQASDTASVDNPLGRPANDRSRMPSQGTPPAVCFSGRRLFDLCRPVSSTSSDSLFRGLEHSERDKKAVLDERSGRYKMDIDAEEARFSLHTVFPFHYSPKGSMSSLCSWPPAEDTESFKAFDPFDMYPSPSMPTSRGQLVRHDNSGLPERDVFMPFDSGNAFLMISQDTSMVNDLPTSFRDEIPKDVPEMCKPHVWEDTIFGESTVPVESQRRPSESDTIASPSAAIPTPSVPTTLARENIFHPAQTSHGLQHESVESNTATTICNPMFSHRVAESTAITPFNAVVSENKKMCSAAVIFPTQVGSATSLSSSSCVMPWVEQHSQGLRCLATSVYHQPEGLLTSQSGSPSSQVHCFGSGQLTSSLPNGYTAPTMTAMADHPFSSAVYSDANESCRLTPSAVMGFSSSSPCAADSKFTYAPHMVPGLTATEINGSDAAPTAGQDSSASPPRLIQSGYPAAMFTESPLKLPCRIEGKPSAVSTGPQSHKRGGRGKPPDTVKLTSDAVLKDGKRYRPIPHRNAKKADLLMSRQNVSKVDTVSFQNGSCDYRRYSSGSLSTGSGDTAQTQATSVSSSAAPGSPCFYPTSNCDYPHISMENWNTAISSTYRSLHSSPVQEALSMSTPASEQRDFLSQVPVQNCLYFSDFNSVPPVGIGTSSIDLYPAHSSVSREPFFGAQNVFFSSPSTGVIVEPQIETARKSNFGNVGIPLPAEQGFKTSTPYISDGKFQEDTNMNSSSSWPPLNQVLHRENSVINACTKTYVPWTPGSPSCTGNNNEREIDSSTLSGFNISECFVEGVEQTPWGYQQQLQEQQQQQNQMLKQHNDVSVGPAGILLNFANQNSENAQERNTTAPESGPQVLDEACRLFSKRFPAMHETLSDNTNKCMASTFGETLCIGDDLSVGQTMSFGSHAAYMLPTMTGPKATKEFSTELQADAPLPILDVDGCSGLLPTFTTTPRPFSDVVAPSTLDNNAMFGQSSNGLEIINRSNDEGKCYQQNTSRCSGSDKKTNRDEVMYVSSNSDAGYGDRNIVKMDGVGHYSENEKNEYRVSNLNENLSENASDTVGYNLPCSVEVNSENCDRNRATMMITDDAIRSEAPVARDVTERQRQCLGQLHSSLGIIDRRRLTTVSMQQNVTNMMLVTGYSSDGGQRTVLPEGNRVDENAVTKEDVCLLCLCFLLIRIHWILWIAQKHLMTEMGKSQEEGADNEYRDSLVPDLMCNLQFPHENVVPQQLRCLLKRNNNKLNDSCAGAEAVELEDDSTDFCRGTFVNQYFVSWIPVIIQWMTSLFMPISSGGNRSNRPQRALLKVQQRTPGWPRGTAEAKTYRNVDGRDRRCLLPRGMTSGVPLSSATDCVDFKAAECICQFVQTFHDWSVSITTQSVIPVTQRCGGMLERIHISQSTDLPHWANASLQCNARSPSQSCSENTPIWNSVVSCCFHFLNGINAMMEFLRMSGPGVSQGAEQVLNQIGNRDYNVQAAVLGDSETHLGAENRRSSSLVQRPSACTPFSHSQEAADQQLGSVVEGPLEVPLVDQLQTNQFLRSGEREREKPVVRKTVGESIPARNSLFQFNEPCDKILYDNSSPSQTSTSYNPSCSISDSFSCVAKDSTKQNVQQPVVRFGGINSNAEGKEKLPTGTNVCASNPCMTSQLPVPPSSFMWRASTIPPVVDDDLQRASTSTRRSPSPLLDVMGVMSHSALPAVFHDSTAQRKNSCASQSSLCGGIAVSNISGSQMNRCSNVSHIGDPMAFASASGNGSSSTVDVTRIHGTNYDLYKDSSCVQPVDSVRHVAVSSTDVEAVIRQVSPVHQPQKGMATGQVKHLGERALRNPDIECAGVPLGQPFCENFTFTTNGMNNAQPCVTDGTVQLGTEGNVVLGVDSIRMAINKRQHCGLQTLVLRKTYSRESFEAPTCKGDVQQSRQKRRKRSVNVTSSYGMDLSTEKLSIERTIEMATKNCTMSPQPNYFGEGRTYGTQPKPAYSSPVTAPVKTCSQGNIQQDRRLPVITPLPSSLPNEYSGCSDTGLVPSTISVPLNWYATPLSGASGSPGCDVITVGQDEATQMSAAQLWRAGRGGEEYVGPTMPTATGYGESHPYGFSTAHQVQKNMLLNNQCLNLPYARPSSCESSPCILPCDSFHVQSSLQGPVADMTPTLIPSVTMQDSQQNVPVTSTLSMNNIRREEAQNVYPQQLPCGVLLSPQWAQQDVPRTQPSQLPTSPFLYNQPDAPLCAADELHSIGSKEQTSSPTCCSTATSSTRSTLSAGTHSWQRRKRQSTRVVAQQRGGEFCSWSPSQVEKVRFSPTAEWCGDDNAGNLERLVQSNPSSHAKSTTSSTRSSCVPGVYFDRRKRGFRIRFQNIYVGWVSLSRYPSYDHAYDAAKAIWNSAVREAMAHRDKQAALHAGIPLQIQSRLHVRNPGGRPRTVSRLSPLINAEIAAAVDTVKHSDLPRSTYT